MSDTELPRAQILDLVSNLCNRLPARWDGDAERQLGIFENRPSAKIDLFVTSYSTIGQDEYRQQFDSVQQTLQSNYCGNRKCTIMVKVTSFDMGKAPFDILDQLRIRLRMAGGTFMRTDPTVMADAVHLSLIRTHPIVVLPNEVVDNRVQYVSTMDVEFAFAINVPADDDGGGIIATVNGNNIVPGTLTP